MITSTYCSKSVDAVHCGSIRVIKNRQQKNCKKNTRNCCSVASFSSICFFCILNQTTKDADETFRLRFSKTKSVLYCSETFNKFFSTTVHEWTLLVRANESLYCFQFCFVAHFDKERVYEVWCVRYSEIELPRANEPAASWAKSRRDRKLQFSDTTGKFPTRKLWSWPWPWPRVFQNFNFFP